AHEEHALRREDLRDGALRARPELPGGRRVERQRPALGHGQGPPRRRPDRVRRRGRAGERGMAPVSRDPRTREYARLIVERSLDVQPGWQVLIRSTPLARPALEEIVRLIARRGAYPILRIGSGLLWPANAEWAAEAPEELLGELPEIDRFAVEQMAARITLDAPENARAGSGLAIEKQTLLRKAAQPFYRRSMSMEIPWVGCQFPCPALAQEAGMATAAFEDFLYAAVLRDWDEEARRMERLAARFSAASEMRIVGAGTDLTVGLVGREAHVDEGRLNLPGGEFFFCPVEDSAEGEI